MSSVESAEPATKMGVKQRVAKPAAAKKTAAKLAAQTPARLAAAADPFGLQVPESATLADIEALFSNSSAFASDCCDGCGGKLSIGIDGLRRVCDGCGLILEGDSTEPEDDDAPRAAPGAARLKLVGVGCSSLQPDLFRSSCGDGAAAQKRHVLEEFHAYRQQFIEDTGIALPLDACAIATADYNEVQQLCVKRSQNKRRIMAACYLRACLKIGFIVPKADIAKCMKLPDSGIASGMNFLRSLEADGKLTVDADAGPWKVVLAELKTLFLHLGLGGAELAPLRDAAFDIVKTATEAHVGINSFPRSKVAGATYAVLRRAVLSAESSLSAEGHRAASEVAAGGLQFFCGTRIRKNTVERFMRDLDEWHSVFEPIFKKHSLDTRPGVVKS